MRKFLNKLICVSVAAIGALSAAFVTACEKTSALEGDISGDVSSNGGFVVEKGEYIYFINGSESNTERNEDVVKGAIMRISKSDFNEHSYSRTQTVVPNIAYSGNYDSGLYIYGDYIYYTTPSIEKNSDGEVQSSSLAFKRTKLDGTDTTKNYFVQYPDNTIEYRYVEVDGIVYLLYVAKSEKLYENSYTNLHSVNTQTGVNTLLAYNVDEVIFDSVDKCNPRVFYTMKVPDLESGTASENYNQIYTVTADATAPNEYDFSQVKDYDAEKDPLYVNCGKLVYDGIGKVDTLMEKVTQFNGASASSVTRSAYTYTLSDYQNEKLFYIRTSAQNDTKSLYMENEADVISSSHDPITGNLAYESYILRDGSSADSIHYMFNGKNLEKVIIADDKGLIKANFKNGKIAENFDTENKFYILTTTSPKVLFNEKHDNADYIYYSVSGDRGYKVGRICCDYDYDYYNKLPVLDERENVAVQILDVEVKNDWYAPELIEGQLMFVTITERMTDYPYIFACDLRVDGKVMTNKQLTELNKLYESISEEIEKADEETYEGLKKLLNYGFYTGSADYVNELIQAYVDIEGYNEEHFWSKGTVEQLNIFISATNAGAWKKWSQSKKVNGDNVAANKRDYYYAQVGKMNDKDSEKFLNSLYSEYLQPMPVKPSWYESLTKGERIGLIVGISAAAVILVAAISGFTIAYIVKKRKAVASEPVKKRIKVDTRDDKDVNVYED